MKIRSLLISTGIIILILGIIFHLQGQSIVGPESSFMYSNPKWITYGLEISIVGAGIIGVGIALFIIKKYS